MRKLIYAVLLLAITSGAYWSMHKAELVWQDQTTIKAAELAKWQPQSHQRYEPLAPAAWRALAELSTGGSASSMPPRTLHNASLAAHLGSTLVVFLILALLLQAEGAAFIGAAFFALHPLQTEAVAYASAFKIVLGACFALIAIWQYLIFAQGLQAGPRRPLGRRSYYIGTLAYVLAICTNAAMVVTPLLAWLLTQLLPKQTSLYKAKAPAWRLGLWFALGIPAAVWAIRSQDTTVLAQILPLWMKPVVAGDALSFYLFKTLVPTGIGPDYGRSPLVLQTHWWGYLTWIIPVAMILIANTTRGKDRAWHSAPLLTFFAALAPMLGLIYFSAQTTSTVAGRYAYLAILGPALLAAYATARARRVWVPAAMILALISCAVLSQRQLEHWQNNESLWHHALAINPASPIAHLALGDSAMRQGDWQKARDDYMQVLASNAFSPAVYFNLGEIERLHGDAKAATEFYAKALHLAPTMPEVYERLGATYLKLNDRTAAEANLTKAVLQAPDNEESLRLLGMLLVRRGAYAEAVTHLTKAAQLGDHGHATPQQRAESHALLGLALRNTQQPTLAEAHLEAALKLAPDSREANRALGDIHFAQGQFALARSRYEHAVAGGDHDFVVYNALGKIYAEAKEYSKSATAFAAALAINPDAAGTLQSIGIVYFTLHQQKDAITNFKKALAINPSLAAPHFYLGDIARWQGKEPESIREYQQALKIDPNFAEAHYRLGNYYLKNEQPTLAIQHFQAGLHTAPSDPKLQYALKRANNEVSRPQ